VGASPRIIVSFVDAGLALIGFAVDSTRHGSPLTAPSLLRVRPFSWGNASALLCTASFAAGLLALVLWLQNAWAHSALMTGLAVAPRRSWCPWLDSQELEIFGSPAPCPGRQLATRSARRQPSHQGLPEVVPRSGLAVAGPATHQSTPGKPADRSARAPTGRS
jgi:hypothetical protein